MQGGGEPPSTLNHPAAAGIREAYDKVRSVYVSVKTRKGGCVLGGGEPPSTLNHPVAAGIREAYDQM